MWPQVTGRATKPPFSTSIFPFVCTNVFTLADQVSSSCMSAFHPSPNRQKRERLWMQSDILLFLMPNNLHVFFYNFAHTPRLSTLEKNNGRLTVWKLKSKKNLLGKGHVRIRMVLCLDRKLSPRWQPAWEQICYLEENRQSTDSTHPPSVNTY